MESEEIGGYFAIREWDKPINRVSSPEVDSFVFLLRPINSSKILYLSVINVNDKNQMTRMYKSKFFLSRCISLNYNQ